MGEHSHGERVYLGWQFALPHADPGPSPRRPAPETHPRLDPAWVAAQRREENLVNRPLKSVAGLAAMAGLAVLAAAFAGAVNVVVAGLAIAVCAIGGAMSGYGVWQGERALRARVAAERIRVQRFRADAEHRLTAAQDEHARHARDWQARRFAFENQKRWYGVALPSGIDRVDIAGGTLPGWSALATTLGAYRLAAGGEVTILDLSGGSVASDLVAVARGLGVSPLVWVLPGDLPRLDLTSGLDGAGLAALLANTGLANTGLATASSVASAPDPTGREVAGDTAILERVIAVVGAAEIPRVVAGLRVLAGVGDPLADVTAGLLSADEVVRLSTLYGHDSARRIVAERAWNLVAALESLAFAGTSVPRLPHSPLRVLAVDPGAGDAQPAVLGTFAVSALARLVRQADPLAGGPGWHHSLMVFGADRLRGDVLDRVADACPAAGVGLVLAFRSVSTAVRERLGRGNAAVAFMRLGNAEDAKAASEQLGSEHRFVLSQLTETAGTSVTDTTGTSYTSTVSFSGSVSDSVTVSESAGSGRGSSAADGPLPSSGTRSREASRSRGTSTGESVTSGISLSSAWGSSTSVAAGSSESVSRAVQRSRELLVEPDELQRLPPTALILSYASAAGRSVVLADVNPAIGALPVTTQTPLAEAALLSAGAGSASPIPAAPPPAPASSASPASPASPASNLGPPPARLDWRRPRRPHSRRRRPDGAT
jgi:hypothetical protein